MSNMQATLRALLGRVASLPALAGACQRPAVCARRRPKSTSPPRWPSSSPATGGLRFVGAGHLDNVILRADGTVVSLCVHRRAAGPAAARPAVRRDRARSCTRATRSCCSPTASPTRRTPPTRSSARRACRRAARGGGSAAPKSIIDRVFDAIEAFAGGTPQFDDMTMLVVRRLRGRASDAFGVGPAVRTFCASLIPAHNRCRSINGRDSTPGRSQRPSWGRKRPDVVQSCCKTCEHKARPRQCQGYGNSCVRSRDTSRTRRATSPSRPARATSAWAMIPAQQPIPVDHRQAPDLIGLHLGDDLFERRGVVDRHRGLRHAHFGRVAGRIPAFGNDPTHDVAIGNHPDGLSPGIDDGDLTASVLDHQPGHHIQGRLRGAAERDQPSSGHELASPSPFPFPGTRPVQGLAVTSRGDPAQSAALPGRTLEVEKIHGRPKPVTNASMTAVLSSSSDRGNRDAKRSRWPPDAQGWSLRPRWRM